MFKLSEYLTPTTKEVLVTGILCMNAKFGGHNLADGNVFHHITTYALYDEKVHTASYAVKNGYLDLLRCVISFNSDRFVSFSKLMYLAVRYGHLNVVELLREEHSVDISSVLLVCTASEYGRLDILENLHQNGALLDSHALELSAKNGHLEIVRYLHARGVTFNVFTVASTAHNGHLEVIEYLHQNGADITLNDNMAIHNAATNGHFKVVKYLFDNGARLHNLKRIVLNSVSRCNWQMLNFIDKNCTLEARKHYNQAVVRASSEGNLKAVKYLHNRGADVTAVAEVWITRATRNCKNAAIIAASRSGHLEVVKYLHKHGADIRAGDDETIYQAYHNHHTAVAGYLYYHGADARALNLENKRC